MVEQSLRNVFQAHMREGIKGGTGIELAVFSLFEIDELLKSLVAGHCEELSDEAIS